MTLFLSLQADKKKKKKTGIGTWANWFKLALTARQMLRHMLEGKKDVKSPKRSTRKWNCKKKKENPIIYIDKDVAIYSHRPGL